MRQTAKFVLEYLSMPGIRRPSKHNISAIKRAMTAMMAATERPISGARFFPDGSFLLTVEPIKANAPSSDLDQELEAFEAKHGQGAA
jgi:hypothetical protein